MIYDKFTTPAGNGIIFFNLEKNWPYLLIREASSNIALRAALQNRSYARYPSSESITIGHQWTTNMWLY